MATPPTRYPPYQQPLLEPRTGLVSTPWERFFLAISNGTPGPDGPVGPEGPPGPPGPGLVIAGTVPDSGDLPASGAPGEGWITADDGHLWVWDGAAWVDVGPIQGPIGPTGPTGATGATGPTGPMGPQGIPGAAGANGAAGPIGPTGPMGPAGPPGSGGGSGVAGEWSVLTNGDVAFPELIFAGGDVIMTFVAGAP